MYNWGMEISHVIQALLAARGWTQEQFAEALQTKQNNVSRWLAGVEPRGTVRDQILAMARESGVLDPEPGGRMMIPIMGYIGAGAEIDPDYEQVPPDGFDQVELPLQLEEEVIGLQVRGDSMLPQYADGVVVVVYRQQTRATSHLVGELAAVRTVDGRRYLKMLLPGAKPHTYNLESFNAKPIIGVKIAWASEIIATIAPRHVRRKSKSKERKPRSTGGHESAPRRRN